MNLNQKIHFFDNYLNPFATNETLQAAFEFKEKHIPKKLFRYRRLTKNTVNELSLNSIRLHPAIGQNDKNDSRLTFSIKDITQKQAANNIDRYLEHIRPPVTAEELLRINNSSNIFDAILDVLHSRHPALNSKKEVLEALKDKFDNGFVTLYSQATQTGALVASFSESNEIPLMWNKYANEQKGICIEYTFDEVAADDERRKYLFPVIYRDQPFDATEHFLAKIDEPHRYNRIAWGATMIKELSWKEEREWRIMLFRGRKVDESFIEMPRPSRIYLGSNISTDDESLILRVAQICSIPVEKSRIL